MATNHAVFGIYPNRKSVEEAVAELRASGFRGADVSVFRAENTGTKDFAHEKGSKGPEGFMAGTGTGAIAGGAFSWLVATGVWAIPELEPIAAGGPIMALLAGLGTGGTVGGAIGMLVGLAMPEYEAKRYKGRLRKEGILLSVHCDDVTWVKRAKAALLRTGGEDIASSAERKADFAISDRPMPRRMEYPVVARPAEEPGESERTEERRYAHAGQEKGAGY